MKNLPLLRKYEQETGNQISVASVVTSNNYQYYAESFQFLLDLGIKKLESGIDYYCSWSDEQIQGLREQIEKVFGLYKAYIQKKSRSNLLESLGTISEIIPDSMSILCM